MPEHTLAFGPVIQQGRTEDLEHCLAHGITLDMTTATEPVDYFIDPTSGRGPYRQIATIHFPEGRTPRILMRTGCSAADLLRAATAYRCSLPGSFGFKVAATRCRCPFCHVVSYGWAIPVYTASMDDLDDQEAVAATADRYTVTETGLGILEGANGRA